MIDGQLIARRASDNPPIYRVTFDDGTGPVEIGSISKRADIHQRGFWHWGVDILPLMDHGGRPPTGDADTFEAALQAFHAGFTAWHADLAGSWEKNRDYLKAGAERWKK
jgi:hypothetical protein